MDGEEGQGARPGCDFIIRDDAVYALWADGREERVGQHYTEIAAWWRNLLKRSLPPGTDYNAFVERVFGA